MVPRKLALHQIFIPNHPPVAPNYQAGKEKKTNSFGDLGIYNFIFTLEKRHVSNMKHKGASY